MYQETGASVPTSLSNKLDHMMFSWIKLSLMNQVPKPTWFQLQQTVTFHHPQSAQIVTYYHANEVRNTANGFPGHNHYPGSTICHKWNTNDEIWKQCELGTAIKVGLRKQCGALDVCQTSTSLQNFSQQHQTQSWNTKLWSCMHQPHFHHGKHPHWRGAN